MKNTAHKTTKNGLALREGVLSLGLTFTEFANESKLSLSSINKLLRDDHVRESTRNKAWIHLHRLKRRLEAAPA